MRHLPLKGVHRFHRPLLGKDMSKVPIASCHLFLPFPLSLPAWIELSMPDCEWASSHLRGNDQRHKHNKSMMRQVSA